MKRKKFLKSAFGSAIGMGFGSQSFGQFEEYRKESPVKNFITVDGNQIDIYSSKIEEPVKVLLAADTHLWMNDERGDPYKEYSDRMAGAYNVTQHYQTGEATNPEQAFEETLEKAVNEEVDLLALPGDIFSWPSEAAIEWVQDHLEESGLNYMYVAGNHDWHYEGMEGTLEDLRDEWIEKRLLGLYQGKDPLMAYYDIKGIRFIAIDNSTYQISKEQLEFYKHHKNSGKPLALLVHIPFYAPGKPVNFGCGHPDWGAETDRIFEIERRPQWPEEGHTETTMNFYKEVFTSQNLLGVFAGHIHQQSMEFINGIPQFVTDENAGGAYLNVRFNPISDRDKKLFSGNNIG